MEWTFESCTKWTLGFLILWICVMIYKEYQKLAVAKTTRYRVTLFPIVSLPVILISIPLLMLYYQLVTLILSLSHGKKFAGLLKGQDVVFALSKEAVCHLVFVVEYDTSNSETFYDFAKKLIRKTLLTKFRKCPKSLGIVQKFWGYFYLLRDEMTFEDCLKMLEPVSSPTGDITLEDLTKLLSDYSDSPLPVGNKALWEVLIGTQPISYGKTGQSSSKKSYPVVLKAHHILGDAMHLFKSIIAMFTDDEKGGDVVNPGLQEMPLYTKRIDIWKNKVKQCIKQLHIILVAPTLLIFNPVLQKTEPNLLHGPRLTNKKIICAVVDESQQYMQAMKRIRRKLSGSSFEDILLAAFSVSLSDYCREQSQQIPEYLVAEVVSVPELPGLANQSLHKIQEESVSCENLISIYLRKIPTGTRCGGSRPSAVDALKFLKRERVLLKECAEREVYYWFVNTILPIFPYPAVEMLLKKTLYTAVQVTNMIGMPNITVFGKYQVKDMVGFASNRGYTGITVCSFTYNNLWKLSLIVDKAIISKEEDVQTILNGIYKYILMLDIDS